MARSDRAPLKVAIIMPAAEQRGGAELGLRNLMQQGRDLGIDWIVVFLEDGPMVNEFQRLGIHTRVVEAGRLRQLPLYLRSVFKIARAARHEDVDLIFSWIAKVHLYGSPAAFLARLPSLWYQHGIPSNHGLLDRAATMLPTRGVLTVSKAAAEAQARCRPVRPQRLVYPGIDVKSFDPDLLPAESEIRSKLGLPSDAPLIGSFGRLQRSKGMQLLIEAIPRVLESHPSARCILVGGKHDLEPDCPAYLEDRIVELGLQKQVTMVGFQSNVREWMHAMDVVVQPSEESFGIAIVEAMALRKPVVAAAVGGPTEIISDGVDGVLVPFGNATALANAISRYLRDPELTSRVGAAARKRALEFSAQRFAQDFIAAIRQLAT